MLDGGNRSGRLPTQFRVTRQDIADAAGVSLRAVYQAERRGRLTVEAPSRGRRKRLDLASVIDYVVRTRARRRSTNPSRQCDGDGAPG